MKEYVKIDYIIQYLPKYVESKPKQIGFLTQAMA